MTPQLLLDVFGEAIWLIITLVLVIVVPSLLVGLLIAIFQAATQINEQTLSFLPRLMVILLIILAMGPWMITKLMDQFNKIFESIPMMIG
ncbi:MULTISPECIES: flagellar biosynthesis protein FliQ [Neptunomonas]|uniref:Flagellar biosynthetic protein FliQ n=1 Tax=Neptunomonas qingdaonensis TaxID=1045558 RepID=A0A1I2N199_9GAMM|nr:flagellar biosynthesis protein FliQ [Neptunomonas qingdaonensis]SFF96890.1 flagellar biosynthetic protein FliQ [Neptunomonas qingdaonensis]